jgi:flagellar assembly protein FliH
MPDASVQRGGCVVESDVGVIDASIEARWRQASTQLGGRAAWDDEVVK